MRRDDETSEKIESSGTRLRSVGRRFRIHRVIHSQQRKGNQLHGLVYVLHRESAYHLLVRVLRFLG